MRPKIHIGGRWKDGGPSAGYLVVEAGAACVHFFVKRSYWRWGAGSYGHGILNEYGLGPLILVSFVE